MGFEIRKWSSSSQLKLLRSGKEQHKKLGFPWSRTTSLWSLFPLLSHLTCVQFMALGVKICIPKKTWKVAHLRHSQSRDFTGFMDSCITFLQGLYNLGAKELLLSETLHTELSQVKHQQGGGKLAYSCFSSWSLLSLAEYLPYQGNFFMKESFSNETCTQMT